MNKFLKQRYKIFGYEYFMLRCRSKKIILENSNLIASNGKQKCRTHPSKWAHGC